MKKIITLCLIAATAFACKDKEENKGPVYGDKAEVTTVSAAQDAINQGSSEVIIKNALTEDSGISIPRNYDSSETLSIQVPAGGNNLTISQNASGRSSLPQLKLDVTDAKDLIVNTPDMSVTFDGTTDVLTSYTADNTLTIAATAEVGTLNVQKGNVRLLGKVTTIGTVATGSSILYPVTTAEELRTAMTVTPYNNKTNGGVVLMADIVGIVEPDATVGGITGAQANQDAFRVGAAPTETQPSPAYDGYIIDGNGHTLSGAAYNNILAVYADNVTIKNLTILQTTAQKALQIWKNNSLHPANNAGISIYGSDNAKLNNVTIKDCGKYAVIVNGSTATAKELTTSKNAWGGVNVWNGSLMNEANRRPGFVLESGNMSDLAPDTYAIVAQIESDVTVPSDWTKKTDTESGSVLYSPAK